MNAGEFLDALLGETEGYAAAPTLTGGEWILDEDGKWKNPTGVWRERFFAWPADREKLIEHVTREADRDVYLNPYIRPAKSRKEEVVPDVLQVVHGDADRGTALQAIVDLGAAAVGSGQEGHYHVYVLLTEPVTPTQHRNLEVGLRAAIDGDDKIAPNDVLRPVGAVNRKPTFFGLPPGDVAVAHWPEKKVSPQELAAALGVDLDAEPKVTRKPKAAKGKPAPEPTSDEPVDLTGHTKVADALAEDSGDRSGDTYRILGVCYSEGLTLEQARAVVRSREDLRARLDRRSDDDVAATWDKLAQADNTAWIRASVKDPEPPADVDGAALLRSVSEWFARYICFTDTTDADLLALWCIHTFLAVELYTSPRLQVDSTVPESGKTTVLEHLDHLAYNPIQAAAVTSAALIPRLLEGGPATILIDEVDRTLRPDKPTTPDLLAILNSGYKVGGKRPVLVQSKGGEWEPRLMSTFAPVAMAGNAPALPDDTKSRSIRVLLMPDIDNETEDSDWELIEEDAAALQQNIAQWADSVRESIRGTKVELPEGCTRRSRERWRPLKRVAVAAGGEWPGIADGLIVKGLAEDAAIREAGLQTLPPSMILLTDLHSTWVEDRAFMSTRDLVERLIAENPSYWSAESAYGKELTETRFGKLIAQASKLTSVRPDHTGPRGFTRAQLEPVWKRLGIPHINPAQPGQPGPPGPKDAEPEQDRAGSAGSAGSGQVETEVPEDISRCACGNKLVSPEAIEAGSCRPCRDRS